LIFIDSNIPMYIVGGSHPNKALARRLLERAVVDGERLVTSAEVFQEILHRYVSIRRRQAIRPAFEALSRVVDEVFSVGLADTERARDLILERESVSARDALHVAVMEREKVDQILTFDTGFDGFPGIRRVAG
jgi:predicted nucleic acid-binding protein